RPVLDRAARIEPFGLGIERDMRKLLFQQANADQRRVADPLEDGLVRKVLENGQRAVRHDSLILGAADRRPRFPSSVAPPANALYCRRVRPSFVSELVNAPR